jgi:Lysozyme like domain
VASAHRHGRKVKIVRSGRHTQPSQVEKVAEKAGKAAPVMAISAGALVAVPHGHAVAQVKHSTVAESVTTARTQTITAGEALAIAKATHANSTSLGAAPQTTAVTTAYIAKHAKTGQSAASVAHAAHVAHEAHLAQAASAAHAAHLAHEAHLAQASSAAHAAHLAHLAHLGQRTSVHTVSSVAPTSHGDYSCSGLESLWEEAGGSSSHAFLAAEIAMAESGGNPNAVSPTDDFGLWQINGSHGSMATLNPLGNARSAVSISSNGRNWGPWTTFTSGAYAGKC